MKEKKNPIRIKKDSIHINKNGSALKLYHVREIKPCILSPDPIIYNGKKVYDPPINFIS